MRVLAAELRKVRHRLSTWILLAVPLVWIGFLGYILLYLIARNPPKGANLAGAALGRLRHQLYPDHFVQVVLNNGNALAAVAVIFGVLTFGSEFGWGTWKLLFTQGPGRVAVYLAKVASMLVVLALMVIVLFAGAALVSTALAAVDGASYAWPAWTVIAEGLAAAFLVALMWAAFGSALAVLMRQSTMAMALGLIYAVVFEGVLASLLAALAPSLRDYTKPLPGANATALFASFGSVGGELAPHPLVPAEQAVAVIGGYLVVFLVLAGVLLARRDAT